MLWPHGLDGDEDEVSTGVEIFSCLGMRMIRHSNFGTERKTPIIMLNIVLQMDDGV